MGMLNSHVFLSYMETEEFFYAVLFLLVSLLHVDCALLIPICLFPVTTTAFLNYPLAVPVCQDVELYCGKPNEPGNQDGVVTSAKFHSPHGITNMGSTLIVCDSGNKSIRLISNAGPLRNL